jgi:hypothetical protein
VHPINLFLSIALVSSLLSSIRLSRSNVRPSDSIRLLYIVSFLTSFFLQLRQTSSPADSSAQVRDEKEEEQEQDRFEGNWGLDMVSEILDEGTLGYLIGRTRGSFDDGKRRKTELMAGVGGLGRVVSPFYCFFFSGS